MLASVHLLPLCPPLGLGKEEEVVDKSSWWARVFTLLFCSALLFCSQEWKEQRLSHQLKDKSGIWPAPLGLGGHLLAQHALGHGLILDITYETLAAELGKSDCLSF